MDPKKRRSRRRLVALVILGLLLGGIAAAFLRLVYNPFSGSVRSPLVLVPDDMDFVLWVPDFPRFAGTLPDQDFAKALDEHAGFQDFLDTPWARRTGVADTLRTAFRELNKISVSLPFGLSLLGDVSGTGVVVAGYLPEESRAPSSAGEPVSPDDLRFMAVLQPKSWLAVAAANILLSPRLTAWFLKDELARRGVEVEHFRDFMRLRPEGGRDLFLARIADAVLISTEGDQLGRIGKEVALDGLPTVTAQRYAHLVSGQRSEYPEARLLARKSALQRFIDVEKTLRELWGEQTFAFAESCLPRAGGDDLVLGLEVGRGFALGLRADQGPTRDQDLPGRLEPFFREDALAYFEAISRFLPDDVFGLSYLHCRPSALLDWLLQRKELVGQSIVEEVDRWLSDHPDFRGRQGLLERLDRALEPRLGCVFFKQPREEYPDKAEPGFAVVIPIKDQDELRSILDSTIAEIRRRRGERGPKDLVRRVQDGIEFYDLEAGDGVFDDYRVTRPGLALAGGYLVFGNFQPFADRIPEVLAGKRQGAQSRTGLLEGLQNAPRSMLLLGVVDGEALEPYLDQSAAGWATSRTTVLQTDYIRYRQLFATDEAPRKGLKPGTREYAEAEERFVIDRTEAQQSGRREDILRTIREHIGHFRGLLGQVSVYVEDDRSGVVFGLRVDTRK